MKPTLELATKGKPTLEFTLKKKPTMILTPKFKGPKHNIFKTAKNQALSKKTA